MKSVPFGTRSGYSVCPVSIGAMRFPKDLIDAVALVRRAIDAGMKYIDVSRGYGEAEFVLSRALRDGYREKVILSTKCSPWITKPREEDDGSGESVYHRIKESMARLDVEYLDFYQVWNVNTPQRWELATKPGGMLDGIRRAMDEGLVKHTGFTTHDTPENVEQYLRDADWCEAVLLTCNLLNRRYEHVFDTAHELGIGTIVMNPVGGGTLAENSPVLKNHAKDVGAVSVPDLAIRYLLSNPSIDTALCGMHKPSDVDESVASAEREMFTEAQREKIRERLDELSPENVGFCTGCEYCVPCPEGVEIPKILRAVYNERFLGLSEMAKRQYKNVKVSGESCTHCGVCETKCTQDLDIRAQIAWAHQQFTKNGVRDFSLVEHKL